MHYGSCLCGAISFSVKRFAPKMAHCHCTDCRKFHGAAFSTFGEAQHADIVWHTGMDTIASFVASNGSRRQFCPTCGSSLTFASAHQRETIEIALATLDTSEKIAPDAHVFVDSKVIWFEISDQLPRFFRGRPT